MIDLEALRREIADKLERHFGPMFVREMRLNFVAILPSNPNANLFVGQSSPEQVREALAAFVPAPEARHP